MVFGLINDGNKCFALSSIQLLSRAYFAYINDNYPVGSLPFAWLDIVKVLTTNPIGAQLFNISNFINQIIHNSNGLFTLNNQEDSHEFIIYFISKLNTQLLPKRDCNNYNLLKKFINKTTNNPRLNKILSSLIKSFDEEKEWNDLFDWYGCWNLLSTNGEQSVSIEKFNSLMLPITSSSLSDCIDSYFSKETLDDNRTRKLLVWYFPKYLLITLVRFDYRGIKNTTNVSCPLHLQLNKYELNINQNNVYKLIGCIMHQGNTGSGHYYCVINENNKWFKIDDCDVTEINELNNRNVYILLYSLLD
jgi:ubiquitin C-terminal hydrolase